VSDEYVQKIERLRASLEARGFVPGATVYLSGDLGDNDGTKSVTVPDGTPARLTEYTNDGRAPHLYARFEIPTSPGQKRLVTHVDSVDVLWMLRWPHDHVWQRILEE